MISAAAQHAGQWLRDMMPISANLTSDSRQVTPGDVFIAYPGETFDGRSFVSAAVASGAGAILFDPRDGFVMDAEYRGVHVLAVAGLKRLAGEIAACWYDEPSRRLYSIGVTGTQRKIDFGVMARAAV